MSWNAEKSLEEVRSEFLDRWAEGKASVCALCREYGISSKTAYKWRKRREAGGSLQDGSRRPKSSPNATSAALVSEVLALRSAHPTLGGKKISLMLKRRGLEGVPAGSTVTDILRRHGLLNERAVSEATHLRRFSKAEPNEMWQVDFKGHFGLASGDRCHPLNVVDDCSRYAIMSVPLLGETFEAVRPPFIRAFREYGLPETILCDNGNPWGAPQRNGITAFEVWAMELGVLVVHGRPLHPQTQGKEESFNKSWKRECLERLGPMPDLLDVITESELFRGFYNDERPHFGLGGKVPSDVYRKSARTYPETIKEWGYPADMLVRRVGVNGSISWHDTPVFVGTGLRGKQIAMAESRHRPGCFDLFFRDFRIGRLNLATRTVESLRAYRLEGDPRARNSQVC
jgi:transposase InsO family protein